MRSNIEKTTITKSISSSSLSHSYGKHPNSIYDVESVGRVHLITSDLWEAITGEKMTTNSLYHVIDSSFPINDNLPYFGIHSTNNNTYLQISKDPQKSRALQHRITEASESELSEIFNSLLPCLYELVYDQSANFVIQKLCEYASNDQHQLLLKFFLANALAIVEHQIACRVLQRFIECTSKPNTEALFAALKQNLLDLCLSPNGNHIVQRFVIALPEKLPIIISTILPSVTPLAMDNCGCRIVQRLFEQYPIEQLSPLVNEVMKNASELAINQYGNYVVQYILASQKREYVANLLYIFRGRFYSFSIHKFASNVIEKCISSATQSEREAIFAEIIGYDGDYNKSRILSMAEDQFGNYVIQRIIEYGSRNQKYAVYSVFDAHYNTLHLGQYSRHVLTRLMHLGFDFNC